jgi:Cu-processing system permease protein
MNSFVLTGYILKCAKKDKIFFSMLGALVFGFLFACFIGSTAAYEQSQMQIVYASGIFRVIFVYGFAIFNAFFITKMFQTREIETLLAGPVPRSSLIFSLMLANFILISLLVLTAVILLKCVFFGVIPTTHLAIWAGSLVCETMMIVAITSLFALMLENTTSAILLTTIFYITSRIMGFIVSSITLKMQGVSIQKVLEFLIMPIAVFFPRLDLFSQSSWLIYTDAIPNLTIIVMQSLVYIPLIFLACVIDFNKKIL